MGPPNYGYQQSHYFRQPPPSSSSIGGPLIVVVSIIVILIISTAVLYMWALSFIRSDKMIPTFDSECYVTNDGDYLIEIIEMYLDAVCTISCNYIIVDDLGNAVPGEQGSVKSIYGLDLAFSDENVSFLDNDRDGRLSAGDQFLIRSVENGGVGVEGYDLLVKYDVSGDVMNRIRLTREKGKNIDATASKVETEFIDSGNITVYRIGSVIDRFHHLNYQELHYFLSFVYTGDEERNITVLVRTAEFIDAKETILVQNGTIFNSSGVFSAIGDYYRPETQNFSIKIFDTHSNTTLYSGIIEYVVIIEVCGSPSFLHSPPLQFVTIVVLFTVFSISSRKSSFIPRKHK